MSVMLAEIASGDVDAADVMFLIAAILFAVLVVVELTATAIVTSVKAAAGWAGLCLVAIGLLLL